MALFAKVPMAGRRALVTGAAGGIGRAVALELARRGTHLYLVDVDEAGVRGVASEAIALGVSAVAAVADLSQPQSIDAMLAELVERWGYVDLLVNNAGVAYYGPTENMTAEQWNWLMNINLLAPIQITRTLLPMFLERPGSQILNICSISGIVAGGRFNAYHTSKFGLVGFTEALRAEYYRKGIGVTMVCPGPVSTNLYNSAANGRNKPVPNPPGWISATPERVATRAIRGLERNKRMVLVTPLAYFLYYAKRLAPGLLDGLNHISRKRRKPLEASGDAPAIWPVDLRGSEQLSNKDLLERQRAA